MAESAWRRGVGQARRARQVEAVYAAWDEIAAHPRRYSFMSASPLDALRQTDARVYVAYGTRDRNSPAVGNDVLRAELVRLGRDATVERRVALIARIP